MVAGEGEGNENNIVRDQCFYILQDGKNIFVICAVKQMLQNL